MYKCISSSRGVTSLKFPVGSNITKKKPSQIYVGIHEQESKYGRNVWILKIMLFYAFVKDSRLKRRLVYQVWGMYRAIYNMVCIKFFLGELD